MTNLGIFSSIHENNWYWTCPPTINNYKTRQDKHFQVLDNRKVKNIISRETPKAIPRFVPSPTQDRFLTITKEGRTQAEYGEPR